MSALNGEMPSPYLIEVSSEKAVLLKIHIDQFMWYFGGEDGEPILQMRANIIMKTNWLRMKK